MTRMDSGHATPHDPHLQAIEQIVLGAERLRAFLFPGIDDFEGDDLVDKGHIDQYSTHCLTMSFEVWCQIYGPDEEYDDGPVEYVPPAPHLRPFPDTSHFDKGHDDDDDSA